MAPMYDEYAGGYPTSTPTSPPHEANFSAGDLPPAAVGAAEGDIPSLRPSSFGSCKDCPQVGNSSNILLLYQLSDLRQEHWVNLILSILCLAYIGIQLVLFVFSVDWAYVKTIMAPFHFAEFWATFAFSIVDVITLLLCVKGANQVYYKPIVLKILAAGTVILALVPAVLISFDLKRYGIQAHNVEYTGGIFLSLVDVLLWMSVIRKSDSVDKTNILMLCLAILVGIASMIELIIFNVMLNDTGKQVAHLMEFTFNIVDASITFWFLTDNRAVIGCWIQQLLEAPAHKVV